MSQDYTHLALEDRCSIARLYEAGQSIRQTAAALDRPPPPIVVESARERTAPAQNSLTPPTARA